MKIELCLLWGHAPRRSLQQAFKSPHTWGLLNEYTERLGRSTNFQVSRLSMQSVVRSEVESLWLCEAAPKGKDLSSVDLAKALSDLRLKGTKKWRLLIGPADGFSEEDRKSLKADFTWSLGRATWPHELAAALVTEQLYRAESILKGHPYHQGH